jgi:hypothetical protein
MRRIRYAAGAALVALAASAPAANASWQSTITNPWLPFHSGAHWTYRGLQEEPVTSRAEVLLRHRRIDGVRVTIVRDVTRTASGELVERTFDWYAQDSRGRVWYFGEFTTDSEGSHEGSWTAGVGGAKPGIVATPDPFVGEQHYQEHAPAQGALDQYLVSDLDARVRTPALTRLHGVLRTLEFTTVEPGIVETKLYVRGVGLVKERSLLGEHDYMVLTGWGG